MKSIQRAGRDVRKLTRTFAATAATARKSNELAVASGEVIAHRMALGAAAFADPMTADHVEFSRMVPEKMAALSAVAAILQRRSTALLAEMARFARSEAAIALRAAGEITRCRTPADIAAAQSRFVLGWFARAISQSLTLGGLAMSAGGAMLVPVHRAATDNAKRLRR
jgi:hypothetical protein